MYSLEQRELQSRLREQWKLQRCHIFLNLVSMLRCHFRKICSRPVGILGMLPVATNIAQGPTQSYIRANGEKDKYFSSARLIDLHIFDISCSYINLCHDRFIFTYGALEENAG